MTKNIQVSQPVCSATAAGRVLGPLKAPKNQEGDSPNFVEILLTPALYSDPMASGDTAAASGKVTRKLVVFGNSNS